MNEQNNEELMHYGVKGMKWGVRRDATLLASHRRNAAIKRANEAYEYGYITKEQRKAAISKARSDKKRYLDKLKEDYESTSSESRKNQIEESIRKQTIDEVPRKTVAKGLSVANNILTGVNIASTSVSALGVAVTVPALAPVAVASLAGYTAGTIGRKWVLDRLIDANV